MIVTEEQADKKWCAHVNGEVIARERAENGRAGPNASRCIGSHCMAWRWIRTHVSDPNGGPDLVESTETYGMCGLAGPRLDGVSSP